MPKGQHANPERQCVHGALGFTGVVVKLGMLIQQRMQKLKNFPFSPCHKQQLSTTQHRGRNTLTIQQGLQFLCRSITLCPGSR